MIGARFPAKKLFTNKQNYKISGHNNKTNNSSFHSDSKNDNSELFI